MNRTELKNTISGFKTAVPVSFDMISKDTSMRVKDNPCRDALKHVTISGFVGASYPNAVNNQLGREDKDMTFEAQSPKWFVHINNNIGTNPKTGKFYIPMKVQSASKPVYMLDGVDVTDQVQKFIPEKTAPKTQENLDTKVVWRTPCLDSIVCVRMLGAEFQMG